MASNDLTYGEANAVAERLMSDPNVCIDDLHSALINAMRRIAALEREVAALEREVWALEREVWAAGNIASCLANGIKPD